MFDSLLQWESPSDAPGRASEPCDKPMRPMRIKNPKLKNKKPEGRPRYPRLIKPGDFLLIVQQHKWLESEKQGRDIGLETAMEDWLSRFGDKIRICS